MADSDDGLLLGGRYRLGEQLGRGGMGVVWRSRDELLGREVAVKEVLLPAELSDAERTVLRERTLREARSAARLSHPSVVTIFDVVEQSGRPWIVMEFVPSRTLADVVRDGGPLPPHQVAEIGRQVLAALRTAHAAGVLHRDVKPSNVLLGDDGRAVLTDFGIATLEGDPSLTTSGMVLGSPAYLAPERAHARPAGPESDLWSLGATLYLAVEGRPPFDRGAPLATVAAVVSEAPDRPQRAGPVWPVIDGLLRKDPQERISAEQADQMLRRIASGPEPSPPEAVATGNGKVDDGARTSLLPTYQPVERPAVRRGAGLVGAVLVLATIGVLGWILLNRDDGNDPAVGSTPSVQPSTSPRSTAPATRSETPSATKTTTTTTTTTTTPTAPTSPSRAATETLPAGFRRYADPSGFSLAVPAEWSVSRRNGRVYFREPGGSRLLIIDQTDQPQPDPVADWQQQERARRDGYRDYQRVAIEPVDYFRKAADWEFTYAGSSGRLHVRIRGTITSSQQAYGIYWSTSDSRWQDDLSYWQTFTRTFRPDA